MLYVKEIFSVSTLCLYYSFNFFSFILRKFPKFRPRSWLHFLLLMIQVLPNRSGYEIASRFIDWFATFLHFYLFHFLSNGFLTATHPFRPIALHGLLIPADVFRSEEQSIIFSLEIFLKVESSFYTYYFSLSNTPILELLLIHASGLSYIQSSEKYNHKNE